MLNGYLGNGLFRSSPRALALIKYILTKKENENEKEDKKKRKSIPHSLAAPHPSLNQPQTIQSQKHMKIAPSHDAKAPRILPPPSP